MQILTVRSSGKIQYIIMFQNWIHILIFLEPLAFLYIIFMISVFYYKFIPIFLSS